MLSPAYCDNKAGVTDNTVPVGNLRRPRRLRSAAIARLSRGRTRLPLRSSNAGDKIIILPFLVGRRRRSHPDNFDSHRVRTLPRNSDSDRVALSLFHTSQHTFVTFPNHGAKAAKGLSQDPWGKALNFKPRHPCTSRRKRVRNSGRAASLARSGARLASAAATAKDSGGPKSSNAVGN